MFSSCTLTKSQTYLPTQENIPAANFSSFRIGDFYLLLEEELSFFIYRYSEISKNWLQRHCLDRWLISQPSKSTSHFTTVKINFSFHNRQNQLLISQPLKSTSHFTTVKINFSFHNRQNQLLISQPLKSTSHFTTVKINFSFHNR